MVKQSGFYWSKRQWVAVASAGPYASLHLDPDRKPRQHPTTRLFTGQMPFLLPNQQCQSTEGIVYNLYTKGPLNGCVCVIHIHFWLFTLSQRKTNYTCTPYLNMVPHFHHINLWTAKLFYLTKGLLRSFKRWRLWRESVVGCHRWLWKVPVVRQAMSQEVFRVTTFCINTCFQSFLTWSVA